MNPIKVKQEPQLSDLEKRFPKVRLVHILVDQLVKNMHTQNIYTFCPWIWKSKKSIMEEEDLLNPYHY